MHPLLNNGNNNFLQSVHPFLRELFYKLYVSYDITLQPFADRTNLCKLKLSDSKYTYAYRLRISYATKILHWDIIFNPNDLTRAPDFNFNNEAFEEFIYRNDFNKCLPDWLHWNVKKSESLALIIKSFIELFIKFQETELQKVAPSILVEYNAFKTNDKYNQKDIELFVDASSSYFLITLYVNLSQLPEFIQHIDEDGTLLNPMQDYTLLAATFQNDGRVMSVKLINSPRLTQFMGEKGNLNVTPCVNIPLTDYIPRMTRIVQEFVDKASFRFQFRREFIASLLVLKGKSIIEYDAFYMKHISFLCEVDGSYFLVKIRLEHSFPDEKAHIEVFSFHNFSVKQQFFKRIIFKYEDCPETVPDKMVIHILDQLKNFIVNKFKLVPMETE